MRDRFCMAIGENNVDVFFKVPGSRTSLHRHTSPERMVLVAGGCTSPTTVNEAVLKPGTYAYGPANGRTRRIARAPIRTCCSSRSARAQRNTDRGAAEIADERVSRKAATACP
jgi:hypothetical protein